jgi:hypothetical protein
VGIFGSVYSIKPMDEEGYNQFYNLNLKRELGNIYSIKTHMYFFKLRIPLPEKSFLLR